MRLLLAPHSDDEALFASYTILRLKPVVVICTDYDGSRGPTSQERRGESIEAMKILGAKVIFLGIPERELTQKSLLDNLKGIRSRLEIYAPAVQGGHPHHDLVGSSVCASIRYSTYTKTSLHPSGDVEIVPTDKEFELKKMALACYKSQWKLNPQHFEAVLEARSEFYISH